MCCDHVNGEIRQVGVVAAVTQIQDRFVASHQTRYREQTLSSTVQTLIEKHIVRIHSRLIGAIESCENINDAAVTYQFLTSLNGLGAGGSDHYQVKVAVMPSRVE